METTNQSVNDAVEALMAPVESETAEVETTEAEVEEVVEEEVEVVEEADIEESDKYEDEDEGNEEYEAEEQEADQSGPETFTVTVDGEEELATLDDLKRDYSGQRKIQKGMKQAAETRKQAEEAFNGLNQQRQQLDQLLRQVQEQGVIRQPTPPTKEMLQDDPLGYIEADANYREDMGKFQAQRQQFAQQGQAQQAAQGQANKAHLQQQMQELTKAIPDFGDAKKAPKLKENLVKQGSVEGFSPEEIGGITDHRAMKVLHKAMLYDQLMAGTSDVKSKLKKARPLMKAGAKKQPDSAKKKQSQQMSRLKKSGSVEDAVAMLFNS